MTCNKYDMNIKFISDLQTKAGGIYSRVRKRDIQAPGAVRYNDKFFIYRSMSNAEVKSNTFSRLSVVLAKS